MIADVMANISRLFIAALLNQMKSYPIKTYYGI